MAITKEAAIQKRAAMKEFIREAKDQLVVKYAGASVTDALRELMVDDLTDMVKQAFPDDPLPELRVDFTGTRAVKIVVNFEPLPEE